MGEGAARMAAWTSRGGAVWHRTLFLGANLQGEGAGTTAADEAGGSAGGAAEPQLLPAGHSGSQTTGGKQFGAAAAEPICDGGKVPPGWWPGPRAGGGSLAPDAFGGANLRGGGAGPGAR